MLQALFDILKIAAGLAVLVWFGWYIWTHDLPNAGRLRWRNDRRERHK
jgi:hypothetical protein